MNSRDLDDDVEGVAAAHLVLLQHLDALLESGELDPAALSMLPDWTVGHLLTHLARNADGTRGMLEGASRGEQLPTYPGGPDQRNSDIESGSKRGAEELVTDVRMTIWKLDAAWVGLDAEGWAGGGKLLNGEPVPATIIPFRRWREVEVHHVDLGVPGFGVDDWSDAYVAKELAIQMRQWKSRRPMGMTDLPQAVNGLSAKRRLAWLISRLVVDGVEAPGPWS